MEMRSSKRERDQKLKNKKPVYESVYGYDGSKNPLERYDDWCWNKLRIYFLMPLISFYMQGTYQSNFV